MKKRKTSYKSIALRIISLALCMWLCIVGTVTWTVSEDMFRQVKSATLDWAQRGYPNRVTGEEELDALPGSVERAMISGLWQPYFALDIDRLFPFVLPQQPHIITSNDWIWGKWDLLFGFDFSVTYFDENGAPIMTSGNRLTFTYSDAESWQSKEPKAKGIAWVDLDAIGAAEVMKPYTGDHYAHLHDARIFLPVVRLTGWFEGNEFHPITLENGRYYGPDAFGLDLNEIQYSVLDKREKLEWQTLVTAPAPQGQELTTIYGWDVDGHLGDYQKPVSMNGVKYPSITALRLATDDDYFVVRGLWESIVSATVSREDVHGKYSYSLTVRCKPLQYAVLRLIPAYLVSALLVALAVWLILWRIRRNLTKPLEMLNESIANNWIIEPRARWVEPYALESWCSDTRQVLLDARTEVTRLNTALDYARDAEEYRKRLISDITHELKTPLAVIHSYAEGLQADIAPEKREQYVQVILDETERMDGMVLQMLELSRLEAGRVKLEMDRFSLGAVIRRVAARFEPLMRKKSLNLMLELDGEVEMNGDEARMEQVITNYLSNAVRYTPEGGDIVVRAISGVRGVYFNILNSARHLSEDGLRKVYDSFYREDASRTEKSTGLGLAIVKQVMALHGSQCYVNNTTLNGQTAVEFGFYPQD